MTANDGFDRISRAWLDLMPDEAPDRAVRRRPPGRRDDAAGAAAVATAALEAPDMNRALLAAAIVGVAVVAVGGGLWLTRSNGPTTGAPSLSPSPSDSPSASEGAGGPVPSALRATWMGDHRDPVAADAGASIVLSDSDFHLVQSAGSNLQYLQSTASATGDGQIRLVTIADSNGCTTDDVGVYSWSLSPSSRVLSLTEEQDACTARAGAVAGDLVADGLHDRKRQLPRPARCGYLQVAVHHPPSRVGAPPGGRWSARLTYTVPEGWANSSDWPDSFELVPAPELPPVAETDRRRNIGVFRQPSAMTQDRPCSDTGRARRRPDGRRPGRVAADGSGTGHDRADTDHDRRSFRADAGHLTRSVMDRHMRG